MSVLEGFIVCMVLAGIAAAFLTAACCIVGGRSEDVRPVPPEVER